MPENDMTLALRWLFGPELFWAFCLLLVVLVIKISRSPVKNMDRVWIKLAFAVPFIAIPLTFALWFVPAVERDWLLLRVWVAGLFGAHFVLEKGLDAHSEQGPGVGTAYIFGMIFAIFMLIAGTVFVKIWFW